MNGLIYQSKVEYWWNSSSLLINPVTVLKQHLKGSRWYFASHWQWSVCNVTESQLIQLIITFCLLESPNDLASMARLVTGLSHSLVSECSLFLLVVPAHPLCHWTVAFPRALLWICYYTCFLLTHRWHETIGVTTFLFTCMLTIHLSRLFWVTFPWPGHTPRWNPVLMIPINVCYTLMMVRQTCWLSMLRTVLLS